MPHRQQLKLTGVARPLDIADLEEKQSALEENLHDQDGLDNRQSNHHTSSPKKNLTIKLQRTLAQEANS
jgi:hypothetical protein